jgi:DNA repair protein RecO (recombination protein O)
LHGIVLQSQDIGERDVVTTVYSQERGKVRFVVRGTKKLESTLRSATEPITEGHFYLAERRVLDILSEWEPINFYMELKNDPSKAAIAAYMARFLLELCPENVTESGFYSLFKNIIYILHTEINHDIIKLLIEWGFLKISGLAPEFGICANCGNSGGTKYLMWDIAEGSFYCETCAGGVRPFVKLGLGEINLGKKIEAGTLVLCHKTFTSEQGVRRFQDEFAFDAKREGGYLATFSRAVMSFCGFHLREDIPGWFLRY